MAGDEWVEIGKIGADGLLKTSDFSVILHQTGKTAEADAAYIFALLRSKVPILRGFSELPQTSTTGFQGHYRPNMRENSKSVGLIIRVGSSPTTGTKNMTTLYGRSYFCSDRSGLD